jgi:hypothetical protein
MGRDAVKTIKFYQLVEWDKVFDKRMNVIIEFPQINVDASYDPVEKFFQCLHKYCLLNTAFRHGVIYSSKNVCQPQNSDGVVILCDH